MNNKIQLIKFLNSVDFGIEIANDFYGGVNKFYLTDKKRFDIFKNDAINTIQQLGKITDGEIIEACERAFCGRLEYRGSHFEYTAGQFYDIEIPQAILAVAEYIRDNRKN